jgi:predicted enzyme related to lactoylglutathione lyase
MNTIQRINTVFVYVKDLARAKQFYGDVLGLGKPVIEGKFWIEFALPGGDAHFALHQSDKHDKANRLLNTVKFSFEVADIKTECARLKKAGVKFHNESGKEYGFWLSEFEDPEGNLLRFYQKIPRE